MCISSLLAILAQMVCYTGQQITWEQAMKSELSFALPRYGWDVEPPVKPARRPLCDGHARDHASSR